MDDPTPPPSPLADLRPRARDHAAAVLARQLPNRALCDTCNALITWAVTERGNPIPIDAEPVPHGSVRLDQGPGDQQTAVVVSRSQHRAAAAAGVTLHTSHMQTCPHAGTHRRRTHRRSS